MTIDLDNRLTQEPGVRMREQFRVAGVSDRFDPTSKASIPTLWERLIPRLPSLGAVEPVTYGVSWNMDPQDGTFNYMAAVEILPGVTVPDDLEALEIHAQTYIVFEHSLDGGNLHLQMTSAAEEIWSRRIAKSGYRPSSGPNFEYYPVHFTPDRPSKVYYWIPVIA